MYPSGKKKTDKTPSKSDEDLENLPFKGLVKSLEFDDVIEKELFLWIIHKLEKNINEKCSLVEEYIILEVLEDLKKYVHETIEKIVPEEDDSSYTTICPKHVMKKKFSKPVLKKTWKTRKPIMSSARRKFLGVRGKKESDGIFRVQSKFQNTDKYKKLSKCIQKHVTFKSVMVMIVDIPTFEFPDELLTKFLPIDEFMEAAVKSVEDYVHDVDTIYAKALDKIEKIIEYERIYTFRKPARKYSEEEIKRICYTFLTLFWPKVLESLDNITKSLLEKIKIYVEVEWDEKASRPVLIPDEKATFDNLIKMLQVFEDKEKMASINAMLVLGNVVPVPNYDYLTDIKHCKEQLHKSLNEDFKYINEYYAEVGQKAVDVLSLSSLDGISQDNEFDSEKLSELYSKYESVTFELADTIPFTYNYKAYKFDNTKFRDYFIKKSQAVKKEVAQVIRKCVATEYHNLRRWIEDCHATLREEVRTGKELAKVHASIVDSSTDGLDVVVRNLKAMTSATFDSLGYDPNYCVQIDYVQDLYTSLLDLKEAWKDRMAVLEDVKFKIDEELLQIPSELQKEIDYYDRYHIHSFSEANRYDKISDIVLFMRNIKKWLKEKMDLVEYLHSNQKALKTPLSVIPNLDELKMFIDCFDKLVNYLYQWNMKFKKITDGPLAELNIEDIERSVEETYRTLLLFQKYFQSHIKSGNIENRRFRYDKKYDSSDEEDESAGEGKKKKLCAPLALIQEGMDEVKYLKANMTLLTILTNKNMDRKHWEWMSDISGKNMTPFVSSSFNDYLKLGIDQYTDQFEAISTTATKELSLKRTFDKMKLEWTDVCLNLTWSPKIEQEILGSVDDVQTLLDDHIVKTLSMKGSAYVKPFEAEVNAWYESLVNIQTTLEEWGKVQLQWIYYMPIFSSQDIVAQMQREGDLFQEVNKEYTEILQKQVKGKKYARLIFSDPTVLKQLRVFLLKFEEITNGVNNYLEKKRLYFARFFFLSNDDMLEILSETKDPLRVQPHLRKCFEGIEKLGFNSALEIYSMFSAEDEEVMFSEKVICKRAGGSVEKWLVWVEDMMKRSIRDTIERSLKAYTIHGRKRWILEWPGQVVLCGTQIAWTSEVTGCFSTGQLRVLKRYCEGLGKQLNRVIKLVRGELSEQARTTLGALVVLDVHSKDVTFELYQNKIISDSDFQWLAQLRYYWVKKNVKAKLINASVKYAYEYLGNTPRLVITPLTDRCYRTLVGAYNLHLNGAPEGPAGTGKTETTKDLAKALAVQCVVFNCSDGLNYKAMGKFFKGLASSGAWACFDEFNRIDIEVLSVVAQQILSIIQAVRNRLVEFVFEGTKLRLNRACYVCITMNPGYAGRSELPDNLKVLFRTVAMMVPDYAMIGEISLYSCGFLDARALSVKIVTTYRLCSEQLSSQSHYDYGMRAVKTVLSAAKNLKIAYPNELEEILLLRSIVDVNLPKFLKQDVVLFNGIISDLFPGVTLPPPVYDQLLDCSRDVCKKRNLQPRDSFMEKIIQTFEMMIVRHGFMLVGDPFSGKTSTLYVLSEALTLMKSKYGTGVVTKFQTLNPKSVTMGELYGESDLVSNEWRDGIIADIYRAFAREDTPDRKWVVFDGPVDAVWIENMNTVLDDNKKLCLNSGEVIQMTSVMSMIFEVMDLVQASPATVSRCGMIYMESASLGWRPIAESWNNLLPQVWLGENQQRILAYFDWVIPPCLHFVSRNCKKLCDAGVTNAVRTTLLLFESTLRTATASMTADFPNFTNWLQATVLSSVLWGIGGTLDHKSREIFDAFYRDLWTKQTGYPETGEPIEVPLPVEGLVEDNVFIYTGKGRWTYLVNKLSGTDDAQGVIIETIETLKYTNIMEALIKFKVPFILTGPTGTGKTLFFQKLLMNDLNLEEFIPSFLAFTANISTRFTQELVLSRLLKRNRTTYGPPYGCTAVIFIDDINMPAKEIYGAQPPLELLRQFFDYKYWYESNKKIFLQDMLIVAAMGLPGGSRQEIYARFLRHFALLSINQYSENSISRIYNAITWSGMRKNGYSSEYLPFIGLLITATLSVYNGAMANLLPTPAKCHYLFNLRDFYRVVQGLLLVRKECASDKKILIRLWVHEILRVFYDRLITEQDQNWLFEKIKENVKDTFRENFEMTLDGLDKTHSKEMSRSALNNLVFTNVLDTENDEDKRYEEIPSLDEFEKLALEFLSTYNSMHKSKMNIVLFSYALHHLSRACRILSCDSGCGLLVGVSGSGRQSIVKLAASIYEMILFQPEITANYGLEEWRNDLKGILKESGGRNRNVVFLFSDSQMKEDYFLQDIDSLLNTGEVPNIFPLDEISEIYEMGRQAAQAGDKNANITDFIAFATFVKRCKKNMHLMLAFSPIGSSFRLRARMFPALINCCTIDWFFDWPADSLERVAQTYLAPVNIKDEIKTLLVSAFKQVHLIAGKVSDEFYKETGRKQYVTSASYVEFIKCYSKLMKRMEKELMVTKSRYIGGLDKLQFAAEQVAAMQADLESLQPQLEAAAKETAEMLERIAIETADVMKTREQVKIDEIEANRQAMEADALKRECEADLALALPILEEALAALDTLTPNDITLVKSMKNPPNTVKLVMEAVCVMMDIKPARVPDPASGRMVLDYWGPSVKLLGEMNFLKTLIDYDKDNISPAVMKAIRGKYLQHPDFQPEIVAKASSAAKGLCMWIHALHKYDLIIKVVAPKQEKLRLAEEQYAKVKAELDAKRALLKSLEDKLAVLQEKLNAALARKAKLTEEITICSNKLEKAKQIIGSLGGEKKRWGDTADKLQTQIDKLPGDMLISGGIIGYLGPLSTNYRNQLVADWLHLVKVKKIPFTEDYSLRSILGSEVAIQAWVINGLPNDAFSIDNAIVMDATLKWSLLIDPQGQGNKWLKTVYREGMKVIRLSYKTSVYMSAAAQCVENGLFLLLENVGESLDPVLNPLIKQEYFHQGKNIYLALGDNTINVHKNFKFCITTKLRNPHFMPEVFNNLTVINFSLTEEGLADQLLSIVVAEERPELDEERQALVEESARNKKTLEEAEKRILYLLSTTSNLLEDDETIATLEASKKLAVTIKNKEKEAIVTRNRIDETRLSYISIAQHCASLYYTIDLQAIDPMYQFSLPWFIQIYLQSIKSADTSPLITTRLINIRNVFNLNLYRNVVRSLFAKDKALYSFIFCATIKKKEDLVTKKEMDFLMTGGIGLDNPIPNPSKWLPNKSWDEICRVISIPKFENLKKHFEKNQVTWEKFFYIPTPSVDNIPVPWNTELNGFQQLVLIRIMRPDQLVPSIVNYVEREIGVNFVRPPPFNLQESYLASSPFTPLVFILSPGMDPMQSLMILSKDYGQSQLLESISLGQGQGPIAEGMIEQAIKNSSWVCLQNCHLLTSWMPRLEQICENLTYRKNVPPGFRLWLTSYPTNKFPVTVLENGVKMINEAPTGLKNSILRTYTTDPVSNPKFYDSCNKMNKEAVFRRILLGISFFHAVVIERSRYGPIGWNIPYGFNESDYLISVEQLKKFVKKYDYTPFEAVLYLTGECNYGGRVTDNWDRRALNTLLNQYVCQGIIDDENYSLIEGDPTYQLPLSHDRDLVLQYVRGMPDVIPPGLYGLHTNAEITRNISSTKTFINSLQTISGGQAEGEGDSDQLIYSIADSILAKLPPNFDIKAATEKYPVDYKESMNTVLSQEMERFNRLLRVLKANLAGLKKAVKGEVVMDRDLENVANSLLVSKIPASWAKYSYPSLKPLGSYIKNLIERLEFLQDWYEKGKPTKFWLSGFFFTHAFLTGILQNYARKYRIEIDKLTFDFEVMKVEDFNPLNGVIVYGLFVDGARWDKEKHMLAEQELKVLSDELPQVWIKPCKVVELEKGGRYVCPVYRTSERKGVLSTTGHSTNYVLPIYLDTPLHPNHWIKRGVALLLDLDD